MKRTMITGLFITAALLASPVFAAEDLCGANLQTLKDAQASTDTNMGATAKSDLAKTIKSAQMAQKKHNDKKCIEITSEQIQSMRTTGSGSDGGGTK